MMAFQGKGSERGKVPEEQYENVTGRSNTGGYQHHKVGEKRGKVSLKDKKNRSSKCDEIHGRVRGSLTKKGRETKRTQKLRKKGQ